MRELFSQIANREVRGLHEAAYLLAAFSLGSQVLALVRDRLLAGTFGAGSELDVYFAAFRIPDFLFAFVASFVSVYVLVPFLEEREKKSSATVRTFMASVFTVFTVVTVIVAGIVCLSADWIISKLFLGFSFSDQETLVLLTRIMLLQPILLGMSNLCAALVQLRQRFILYALAPILYNIGIIVGITVFMPFMGTVGLAWGVVLGAALHLATQLPFVLRDGAAPRWTYRPDFKAVRTVMAVSFPRTLTLSSQQLVLLVLSALASLAGAGAISAFNLAYNLQAVPLTLVGVSYSVAAFPTLVRYYANGEHKRFFATVTTAVRHVLFWSLPAMVLLVVLRAHLVRVLLGTGTFNWGDTKLTAACLALFSLSLAAQAIVVLLVRGSYAMGNTRTPLVVNLLSSAFTIGLAITLTHTFSQSDWTTQFDTLLRAGGVESTGVLALVLAYSLGSWVNAIALLTALPKGFRVILPTFMGTLLRGLTASLMGGVAAFLALHVTVTLFDLRSFVGIALHGAHAGSVGLAVWALAVYALGGNELVEIGHAVRARFWKRRLSAGG